MKPGDSPLTSARVAALDIAWARYQSVRRSVYVGAPHAMRRYLRTQDEAAMTVDMTRYLSAAHSGMRGWIAACRKQLGRQVMVEPLGIAVLGMPSAFLVRVPRFRSSLMDERLWGNVGGDRESVERLADMRRLARKERELRRREAHIAKLKGKMTAAVTEARACLIEKGTLRAQAESFTIRGVVLTPTERMIVDDLRRKSYEKHARYARCWARANRYKQLLDAEGFVYDLNSIDTPVDLEEGENGSAARTKVQIQGQP